MITPTQEHKFTSDKPYNRHKYKLTFVDGRSIVFDDYKDETDMDAVFRGVFSFATPVM